MTDVFSIFPPKEEVKEEERRGRGRPLGKKNTPAFVKEFRTELEQTYQAIEHILSDEQRDYYEKAFSGEVGLDPVKDAELFLRLMSIYSTKIVVKGIREERASKEVAEVAAQFRMGLRDLEEMRRKRNEDEMKRKREEADDDEVIVDGEKQGPILEHYINIAKKID